jgi:pimeloyl-ACP methyl ester carboxylesterase
MVVTAVLIALLTALPLLAATAVAYAAARGRRGDAGTEPMRPVDTARAFLREWLAGLALLAAWPFRLPTRSSTRAVRGAAVFVPERYCSSAGFWYLRRRLGAAGWSSLAAVERTGSTTAAQVAAALDTRLAGLPAGTELVLVGHGVGGLLARAYAEAHPELRVRHVITLGTPHQGSRALPYRLLGGSALPALPPPPDAGSVDVIAICSDFDAWLLPVDDAYCPGGFNIAVSGIGHCAMLLSRRVADLIAENLAAPAPITVPPRFRSPRGAGDEIA